MVHLRVQRLLCQSCDATRVAGQSTTHLSVTISKTAPNFEVWPSARAAWPSTASNRQEMQYASVQYFGW